MEVNPMGHSMRRLPASALLLVLLPAAIARPQPVGTAFTYQGRLLDGGNPATGAYDLQLALFDAEAGGSQVGSTITRDDVAVSSGLFVMSLDFGAAFTGSRRWLEIRVRPGASTGTFTTLGARQELTPAPNAVFSSSAPWTGIAGKPAGFADDVDDDGLGALACPDGQIAKRTTGAWACAPDNGHDHAAQTWTAGLPGASVLRVRNLATGASTDGVWGQSDSSQGRGVYGLAAATTGVNYGVFGHTDSTSGYAGYFEGRVAAESLDRTVAGPFTIGATAATEVVVVPMLHAGQALRLQPQSSAPVACTPSTAGVVYYNSVTTDVCVCRGTAYVGIFGAGC
jgi:hypothetical protein